MTNPVYGVSDFVAVCNQVLDVSFGFVQITGELANLRVSKNRWVYFDLKDENASVKFFGSIYAMPGPMEEGMLLVVSGQPQLHPRFGFSVTVQSIQLSGEGTIKKAANLLEAKLKKEGLFAEERKRILPQRPEKIGLITSKESAAYGDFVKVVSARWGLEVQLYDVQVQGEMAPSQITRAIDYFASLSEPPEVLVIIRGGGSTDDLQAFSAENVTRAVAGSRIPTLVAIGHERDVSLAELAADKRASTPSNAAELLVPDKDEELNRIKQAVKVSSHNLQSKLKQNQEDLKEYHKTLEQMINLAIANKQQSLAGYRRNIELMSPDNILKRGYSIVREFKSQKVISSSVGLSGGENLSIQFRDGIKSVEVIKGES